jgi:hypothetical protein
VAAEELPLGGLARYCLKHLREHDPEAADFLETLRRRQAIANDEPLASITRPSRSRLSHDCSPYSMTLRCKGPTCKMAKDWR